MKTLTKILLILGIFLFAFIVTMCVFFAVFREIPETLCTLVLGGGGLELVLTALIEIFKSKFGNNDKGDMDL